MTVSIQTLHNLYHDMPYSASELVTKKIIRWTCAASINSSGPTSVTIDNSSDWMWEWWLILQIQPSPQGVVHPHKVLCILTRCCASSQGVVHPHKVFLQHVFHRPTSSVKVWKTASLKSSDMLALNVPRLDVGHLSSHTNNLNLMGADICPPPPRWQLLRGTSFPHVHGQMSGT